MAGFAAVNDIADLKHNQQRAENHKACGNGEAERGNLQKHIRHHAHHQHHHAHHQKAAERIHIGFGAARHRGHGEKHGGRHHGGHAHELRAVADAQAVLQHRADEHAHAEGKHHQQSRAGVAVAVFLNQHNHAVEKGQRHAEGNPAVAEHGVKIDAGLAAQKSAGGARNKRKTQ